MLEALQFVEWDECFLDLRLITTCRGTASTRSCSVTFPEPGYCRHLKASSPVECILPPNYCCWCCCCCCYYYYYYYHNKKLLLLCYFCFYFYGCTVPRRKSSCRTASRCHDVCRAVSATFAVSAGDCAHALLKRQHRPALHRPQGRGGYSCPAAVCSGLRPHLGGIPDAGAMEAGQCNPHSPC